VRWLRMCATIMYPLLYACTHPPVYSSIPLPL